MNCLSKQLTQALRTWNESSGVEDKCSITHSTAFFEGGNTLTAARLKRSVQWHRTGRNGCFRVLACVAVLICAWTLLVGLPGSAQEITGLGVISGTVSDPSGAAISGAQISVRNVAMNVSQASVTNTTGYFEVDSLNPSIYEITVTASGFDRLVRQGVTLETAGHVNLPLRLTVGHTSQTVVVTADAALLNTESGSNGQVLTTRQLELLPDTGANPLQLAQIAPGIQSPNSQTYSMDDTLSWNGVSKFGVAGYLNANEYSMDGSPNDGNPRGNAVDLSEEEVGEMKTDAVSFDAALGHTMGATLTQTTKFGTNDLHGAIHEMYQDRAWAAMEHFQGLNYSYEKALNGCNGAAASSIQCLFVKYTYGNPGTHANIGAGSVGGPVFIPKLYDGRNKLFFFVAVDDSVFTDASTKIYTIPTVQERSGNFNDLPTTTSNIPATFTAACGTGVPYYGQYQIYNPFSVALDSKGIPRRQPFCGNQIPSGLMATTATLSNLYNSLLPTPDQNSSTGNNYEYNEIEPQTWRQFTQRMDYELSPRDHLFFRWSRSHYFQEDEGFTVGNVDRTANPRFTGLGAFGWNHVFSARTNLSINAGDSMWHKGCCTYPGYQQYSPSSVGLPSYLNSYAGAQPTLPIFNVSGYQQIGEENNTPAYYRNLSFSGTLTHVQGAHTIRAGGEWRQQFFYQSPQGITSGEYTFNDTYTEENNGTDNTFSQSNTGQAYAAFLMGMPTTSEVTLGATSAVASPYWALYAADTWRITPRLTINAGIRYEFEFGPTERTNDQIVGWNATASLPIAAPANAAYATTLAGATAAEQAVLPASLTIQGGPVYAGVDNASLRQFVNDYRILPRFAFSYALTPRTVLRGGWGIYFDTINALEESGSPHSSASGTNTWSGVEFTSNQDGYSTSTSVASSTDYGLNFVAGSTPLSNPFPTVNGTQFNSAIGNAAGAMYYLGSGPTIYDHGMVPTRAQRGYFGVQHQFGNSTMVEVAWLGSLATEIPLSVPTAYVPSTFFAGGTQPNVAENTLLSSKVSNPFAIGNFSSLASTNPAAYGLIALNSYFTASTITVANLVRKYPQMSGLSMYRSVGESTFQELQVNATKRYDRGLTLMAALQINDQHDRDYYANSYDGAPSWEPSDNSTPYRFTAEGLYELPFGRGHEWANSRWQNAVFGGYQLGGSYEVSPGALLTFSNLFYLGTPSGAIKLKHPIYANNQASGGYNYIQWLNPGNVTATYSGGVCTYTGTGFVTNSQCQPNSYNIRAFPSRVNGVRAEGPNTIQANFLRNFHLSERFTLETRFEALNLLNRQVVGSPTLSPTSSEFGQVTSDGGVNGSGNARWLDIQGRLRF